MTGGAYDEKAPWPSTKVTPPRPRAIVSRQRLLEPLHTVVKTGGVVLVVAPGGTGKTTLLADWAREAPIAVAWYALDPADGDPRRLAEGLCMAVEQVMPGAAGRALAALRGGAQEAAVVGLLLGALEHQRLALVLDDFHHLADRPEALALWDHLLRFRPPTLTLLVLSRVVPLLGFSTLASLDQLTGVGADDLSFTDAEAVALLTAHGLPAQSAAQFVRRSGGWAAGVLLLARAAPDGVRFLRARAEALMEHLGAEMLAALPPGLRTFLLESAALGSATPEAADILLGRRDSAARYADVLARGLFLEQEGTLYRYHDLFGEYLVGVLHREDPARLRALRRAAAQWWIVHDDLPRALGLLAADEDWEALAQTLERERSTLWMRGLGGTVLMHVDHLPPAYRTPRLLTLCGYARSQRGEHAEALALADAGMAHASGDEEWLSSALLRVEALVHARRDEDAVRSATAALTVAQRAAHVVAVTRLRELRGAVLLRMGRLAEGRDDLQVALAAHRQARDENGEARTLFNLATQLIKAGHADDTEEHLVRADLLWRRVGNNSVRSEVLNSRARLLCLKGDLAGAGREAEEARAAAREGGYPLLECEATALLADIWVDRGRAPDAERHAVLAAEMAARLDLADVLNEARRARIGAALLQRDRAGARRLIDEARPLAVSRADAALLDVLDGILALRSRAHRRAAEVLSRAGECLADANRPHQAARAYLLCAEALLELGRVRRAEDVLNRLAALLLPLGAEGYLQPLARLTRLVAARRRLLRHLRRDTRLILDRVAASLPHLAVLPPTADEADAAPHLWLSPFGQGRLKLAGRDVDLSALPPKARELLFFAGRAAAPLSRDVLLDTLWEGEGRSAPALWNAGRHLRRLLGEGSWGLQGRTYALLLPFQDEGRRFSDLAALALGHGPAPERLAAAEDALVLVGSGGYLEWCDSSWVMTERNRVRRQSIQVALALARLYEELGRREDAIAVCRRASTFDPLDEAPRLALLQYLIAAGQDHVAQREYSAYQRLLHKELALEPSTELRRVAKRARPPS